MDFPSDGIIFRDISPLIGNYEALNYVLDSFEKYALTLDFDCIAAIDARGFIFGAPIANRLKVPFVPIRKSGKLPPPLKSIRYDLEYGKSSLECKDDILKNNKKVIILAKRVKEQAREYKGQLMDCQKQLERKKYIIF